MHLANGAVFGALYAAVAPARPAALVGPRPGRRRSPSTPPPGRSPRCVGTVHPAGGDFPPLFANPRALAQATWRHLLFGVVLGELERRLNAPEEPDVPSYEHVASTNGHGDLEAGPVRRGRLKRRPAARVDSADRPA